MDERQPQFKRVYILTWLDLEEAEVEQNLAPHHQRLVVLRPVNRHGHLKYFEVKVNRSFPHIQSEKHKSRNKTVSKKNF